MQWVRMLVGQLELFLSVPSLRPLSRSKTKEVNTAGWHLKCCCWNTRTEYLHARPSAWISFIATTAKAGVSMLHWSARSEAWWRH